MSALAVDWPHPWVTPDIRFRMLGADAFMPDVGPGAVAARVFEIVERCRRE